MNNRRLWCLHELDYQRTDYGELYYFKRDFERSLSWLDFGERRAPYRTLFWRALTLAQLGRLAAARRDVEALRDDVSTRWKGATPFTSDDVYRWYMQTIPLKRQIDRDLLLDGLAKVGVNP